MSIWDGLIIYANVVAIIGFLVLIFGPRSSRVLAALLYFFAGQLCLLFTVSLVAILSGLIDPIGPSDPVFDFFSVQRVRDIFASDGAVAFGWLHYLAFDLFVAVWIAKDADERGFSRLAQAPILLATFLAGPVGLTIWLSIRSRKASNVS